MKDIGSLEPDMQAMTVDFWSPVPPIECFMSDLSSKRQNEFLSELLL